MLTFQKGQTSQSFDVATLPDQAVEGNETVVLELSNPTGGATVGARKTNTLTITDGAAVQFSAPAYSVKENVASVAHHGHPHGRDHHPVHGHLHCHPGNRGGAPRLHAPRRGP